MEIRVNAALHPAAPHHLPGFIAAPGETDILMIAVGLILLAAVLGVGNLYLHLHTLPERLAHKTKKLQFEIVAVLGLLALFTHNHLFWVIGLMLALIDLPDFLSPLRSIAASARRIAGEPPLDAEDGSTAEVVAHAPVAVAAPAPVVKAEIADAKADAAANNAEPAHSKADPKRDVKHDVKQDLANREVPRHA